MLRANEAKERAVIVPDSEKLKPDHCPLMTIPRLRYKGHSLNLQSFFSLRSRSCIEFGVTAKDLPIGQTAVVTAFSDEKLAVFLSERGVVAGERLAVERIAPFGDPIAVRVADHLLCLRRKEASAIIVQPEGK